MQAAMRAPARPVVLLVLGVAAVDCAHATPPPMVPDPPEPIVSTDAAAPAIDATSQSPIAEPPKP